MINRISGVLIVLILLVLGYLFYNHSGFFPYAHDPLQYMPNMHKTPVLKPQSGYEFFSNNSSARVFPVGARARFTSHSALGTKTLEYYPYTKETLAAAVPARSNPVTINRALLTRGQQVYMNNCYVCHGNDGAGNGPVTTVYPNPPSLHTDKIRGYADSQIFHVVTVGQNIMGGYGAQINEQDRWALIHYIRVLQKANAPSDEDLKAFENIVSNKKEGVSP